jgi:predicted transcriptional regulator
VARKRSTHLTDAELRLMDVLWEKGSATVSEVVENVVTVTPLAYSTVLTTLRILENKGYIKHRKEGRAFIYNPVVGRETAQNKAISHLLRRFFGNSAELLMLSLIDSRKLRPEELKRLRRRIVEKEK